MQKKDLFGNTSKQSAGRSKQNPERPIKYVTIQEAIRMIPYIKSYCKSIKHKHYIIYRMNQTRESLINLTSLDPTKVKRIDNMREKLTWKINHYIDKIKEWLKELEVLNVKSCSLQSGCIDIPIWDDTLQCVTMICINPDTKKKKLVWHMYNENYIAARPYIGGK